MPPASALQELFDRAVLLPREQRSAFLADACGDDLPLLHSVTALLSAHDRAGSFLEDPEIFPTQLPTERFAPGAAIGPYTLLRILGEGGHGIVYLADQTSPFRRRVAVKVIKAGMDTRQIIARFELERQALAMMDHAHIARVLDAGATEQGRPYFVMEFVDGPSLIDYAREHRLPLVDRLALFLNVCSAVAHAHQKGIIHRDLKPANVLVARGGTRDEKPVPKVIDFGIAKALRTDATLDFRTTLTQAPQFLGTPQYMSPEQAGVSGGAACTIDARTDIYSLGVLLYELLTGSPPFDPAELRTVPFADIHRLLTEVDPLLPSVKLMRLAQTLLAGSPTHARDVRQLAAQVKGDLDWIAMKAMDKDRARRYDSASALADDITAFLTDNPVHAGPPRPLHRARKFLRRHRGSLRLIAIALLAFTIGVAVVFKDEGGRSHVPAPYAEALLRARMAATAVAPTTAPDSTPGLSPGLTASLYAGSDFELPVKTRIDRQISFEFHKTAPPDPLLPDVKYSIRWEGILLIPPAGLDHLTIDADDGARLYLDGRELLNFSKPSLHTISPKLSPGRHTLRIDYWNRVAGGRIMFRWQLPGIPEEVVPGTALFHGIPSAPATKNSKNPGDPTRPFSP